MGQCCSGGDATNQNIDKGNAKDFKDSKKKIKLLLLGAGESGKSTLFKQMNILYGKGLAEPEREKILPFIGLNVMEGLQMLCKGVVELELEGLMNEDTKPLYEELLEATIGAASPDEAMATKVRQLWADPAIAAAWEKRSALQVSDSVSIFVDRMDKLSVSGYVPTQEEVLLCRIRTTGITSQEFAVDGVDFELYDVGGQKSERKKWANCFDMVNAVMFVAALSEYDHTLFEDESVNRMVDALELFKWVGQQSAFANASILLFLNKRDLFEEKVKTVNIGSIDAFSDYGGKPNDMDDGVKYFQDKFIAQASNGSGGHAVTVYPHVTCATDSSVVKFVFTACKEIILQQNFADSGLF